MKKIFLVLICITIMSVSAVSHAKIVADQESSDSAVFYFWESWMNPVGVGTGGFWLAFVKYVDKAGTEKYWIRMDYSRRDTITAYGKIYVTGKEFKIEMVDNPTGMQYRAGIGGRTLPSMVPQHVFYNLTPEMVSAMANGTDDTKITVDFQNRKNLPFPIKERLRADFQQLLTLKITDYASFARKP